MHKDYFIYKYINESKYLTIYLSRLTLLVTCEIVWKL